MNVETISLDPRIAAIHYKDYRKRVRQARAKRVEDAKKLITDGNKMRRTAYHQLSLIEKEDIIAMESYREMAKGARLINVATVIRNAGYDKKQLPNLAIARANWREVALRHNSQHICFYNNSGWLNWSYGRHRYSDPKTVVHFSDSFMGNANLTDTQWRERNNYPAIHRVKAQVPGVPAHLRPIGDLSDFFILFEAKWEMAAPPDPLLLRHVSGHMYSVLAQWDLTPLEKAVLEGRFA